MEEDLKYAGFWIRTLAALIDLGLLIAVATPLLLAIYGNEYLYSTDLVSGVADFVLNFIFPGVVTLSFWLCKQATPGKLLFAARIVDARTGEEPTVKQWLCRYLAYLLSLLPLGLGFLWAAFDSRKQAWHDKLADTVVVRRRHRGPAPVRFQ